MPPWSARGSGTKEPVLSQLTVEGRSATPSGVTNSRYASKLGTEDDDGDGGQVNRRAAEAVLQRRSKRAHKDLEDQSRIYSNVEQKQWEQKYKFFSARHMEKSYRLFTRARHDPFNKDPSWGKSIIHRVAMACSSRQIAPETLFSDVDITGDGNLNRPELKRVVCSVLPVLSDEELTAIFDTIDEDHSGEVNVNEFCDIIKKGKNISVTHETATRWRNPIHRIKRLAPAQVEGWDHLEGDMKFQQLEKLCDSMQSEMQNRLGDSVVQSARGLRKAVSNRPKYDTFGGGGDGDRFHREQWAKAKREEDNPEILTSRITDPGAYPKPGWMYNCGALRERTDRHGTKFELPRQPMSAR